METNPLSPQVTLAPHEPVSFDASEVPTLIENISHFIQTVSVAPAWVPKNFSQQFAIYTNGTTYRFYWCDITNGSWHYVTATA